MVYGYCRCSTNESKQDVNRQRRELRALGVPENCIYMEYESGTKIDRPELIKMLSVVNEGDAIVTTEISRITRSTKQLCDIIELVKEKHLKLIIKDSITIDCSNLFRMYLRTSSSPLSVSMRGRQPVLPAPLCIIR